MSDFIAEKIPEYRRGGTAGIDLLKNSKRDPSIK
jgi:hypothetical protein